MAEVLHVEKREKFGSAATNRVRRAGKVPAVLYGHGEANAHLAIAQSEVDALIRHHGKTVELQGAVNDTAMVNEVQWDALGLEVLHLDLLRVSMKEEVDVTVPIHVHGEAPGLGQGGMQIENVHEVDIRCPAGKIPESVGLSVGELGLNESATASQLDLPPGVKLVTPGDTVLVTIEEPRSAGESEGPESSATEPEVIGRSAGEGGEAAE